MANARSQFDYLAAYLQRRNEHVRLANVLGRPALLFAGRPFVILYRDSVAFRLAGHSLNYALALSGATGFDPIHPDQPPPGKPGWVLIPPQHWAAWNRCALDAIRCLLLSQSQHMSWKPAPPPPEAPPAAPPSTAKSLAERVAAVLKSGFSFGLMKQG